MRLNLGFKKMIGSIFIFHSGPFLIETGLSPPRVKEAHVIITLCYHLSFKYQGALILQQAYLKMTHLGQAGAVAISKPLSRK